MIELDDRQLERIVGDVLGVPAETVNDDLTADDIETWDSFAQVNLMVTLEEAFDVRLDGERFMTLRSVRALRTVVREQLQGA